MFRGSNIVLFHGSDAFMFRGSNIVLFHGSDAFIFRGSDLLSFNVSNIFVFHGSDTFMFCGCVPWFCSVCTAARWLYQLKLMEQTDI
jgi:hypothetical protein